VKAGRTACGALALLIAAQSCTAMREIPVAHYGDEGTRRDVVVETTDGRRLEFEESHAEGDTLVGYRRADEDTTRTLTETRLPFEQITRLSHKQVDKYRTGLVAGVVIVGVAVYALTKKKDEPPSSGPEPPCKTCGEPRLNR
jgi:hypothetical protein